MHKLMHGTALLSAGLLISTLSTADIVPFTDDFESYNPADEETLFSSGWQVFGNVSDNFGTPIYGYGPEPAPNNGGGFSGVAVNEGGVDQGSQQLNTFNDYGNADHNNPERLIEANIYQEQTIGAANVGQTWTFSFQAKRGNLVTPTTALAFIKTIDPNNGFATTNFVFQSTTDTPVTWNGYTISLEIDAGLVGQLFQIGFANTASVFTPSGVFYDNVVLSVEAAGVDSDGDGVNDDTDNCTDVANATQTDTDSDGHGNICDADFDNNCFTTFPDLAIMQAGFFTINPELDLNSSGGLVNFADLAFMQSLFFQGPGPSAPGALCNGT